MLAATSAVPMAACPTLVAISRIITPCVSIEAARSAAISDTTDCRNNLFYRVGCLGRRSLYSRNLGTNFFRRLTSFLYAPNVSPEGHRVPKATASLDVGLGTPRLLSPGSPSAENNGPSWGIDRLRQLQPGREPRNSGAFVAAISCPRPP